MRLPKGNNPRVCKRWFPNGASSFVGERSSTTPCFTSILPQFYLNFTSFYLNLTQRIAKGAGGKGPRQKTSKSVKKFFDTFRQFARRAKNVKNRQKVSNIFSTFFDNFRAALVSGPFWGALINLFLASFLPHLNPCSAGNLELRFGNRGLHTRRQQLQLKWTSGAAFLRR